MWDLDLNFQQLGGFKHKASTVPAREGGSAWYLSLVGFLQHRVLFATDRGTEKTATFQICQELYSHIAWHSENGKHKKRHNPWASNLCEKRWSHCAWGARMAKGTNTRKCRNVVSIVRSWPMHVKQVTGEKKKNLPFLFLANAGYSCTKAGISQLPGSQSQPNGLASPLPAWFLPQEAKMSGQG